MVLDKILQTIPAASPILVILDKDGVLDPFVENPEKAFVPELTRDAVNRLAGAPDTDVAIVSGRSVEQLKTLAGNLNVTYIGLHGNEKYDNQTRKYQRQPDPEIAEKIILLGKNLKKILAEKKLGNKGVILEVKNCAAAIHWRKAPELEQAVTDIFLKALSDQNLLADGKLSLQAGSMFLELKPNLYNKGSAAAELIRSKNYNHIVCIGDDQTDLSMMEAVKESGKPHTIVIVDSRINFPGAFRLDSPEEVKTLLSLLAAKRKTN